MAKAPNEGPAVISRPTAMQAQLVRQVSPKSFVPVPEPFGVLGTRDHAVPSQVSARVAGYWPEVWGVLPGVDHEAPFHISMRFWVGLPPTWPTAWQKVAPAQETDDRKLPP